MRGKQELLVKQINVIASQLLEEYQWDHLKVKYSSVNLKVKELSKKIEELKELLD